MDIARKIEIVKRDIESITTHDDVDAAVLKAALDSLAVFCAAQSAVLDAQVAAEIKAAVGEPVGAA